MVWYQSNERVWASSERSLSVESRLKLCIMKGEWERRWSSDGLGRRDLQDSATRNKLGSAEGGESELAGHAKRDPGVVGNFLAA